MHLAPLCIWASEAACGIAELGSMRVISSCTILLPHTHTYLFTYYVPGVTSWLVRSSLSGAAGFFKGWGSRATKSRAASSRSPSARNSKAPIDR